MQNVATIEAVTEAAIVAEAVGAEEVDVVALSLAVSETLADHRHAEGRRRTVVVPVKSIHTHHVAAVEVG